MPERLQGGIDLSSGEQAKTSVRKHAESDLTWKHHEIAGQLYGWTDRFRDRLIDPVARIDRSTLPGPVIGFDSFDYRILAYYLLGKNAFGLEDEIILNEAHLDRPLYCILETVLHEQLHLWQQRFGQHPVKRNYHNQEFCEKAESLGLHPAPIIGCHYKPADGTFEALLREYGVYKPALAEQIELPKDKKRNWWEGERRKEGRSTLEKWSCSCGQHARIGTKAHFAYCTLCKDPFLPESVAAKEAFVIELSERLGREQDPEKAKIFAFYLLLVGERQAAQEVGQ